MRNSDTQYLGSCEIEDKIELGRQFDRNVRRLRTVENLVYKLCGTPEKVLDVWPVGDQAACFCVLLQTR